MFKENKEFWLYIVGTILMFILLIYGMRSYFGERSILSIFSPPGTTRRLVTVTPTQTPIPTEEGKTPEPTTTALPPDNQLEKAKNYTAVIKTNLGEIKIDLFEDGAPNTVNSFVYLATNNFYDGSKFHRLIPGLLLQGGSNTTTNEDPADDAFGGPGYIFKDEINWDSLDLSQSIRIDLARLGYTSTPGLFSRHLDKNRLAMANAGPDTNGSQFFIIFSSKDDPRIEQLKGKHTVFAEIIAGEDVIEKIKAVEVDQSDPNSPRPKQDIVIEDVIIYAE